MVPQQRLLLAAGLLLACLALPLPRAEAQNRPGLIKYRRAAPASAQAAAATQAAAAAAPARQCPPAGFGVVNFTSSDIREFISAPWCVLAQQPLVYQPENALYCVRARYSLLEESNPLAGLRVNNFARRGSVTGPATGTDMLTARIPDPRTPAKLTVGFSLLGRQLAPGPYWIIAAGRDAASRPGSFDWAIIMGGAPSTPAPGGCRTGNPNQVNGSGLWLFSRKPENPQALALMTEKLQSMGIDTSVLKPVAHAGCQYGAGDE